MDEKDTNKKDIQNYSNSSDDEDDLVSFQFESKNICFCYSHFSKYSNVIRSKYLVEDLKKHFPNELLNFQQNSHINTDNIFLFFQLLQDNFIFKNDLYLTYKQYSDLYKISVFLQVKKLKKNLEKYFIDHNVDIEFIIQLINFEEQNKNAPFQITSQMEELLSTKIVECLSNEQFSQFNVSTIYRIIKKSDITEIQGNLLFTFIKKSFSKLCPLLSLLDLAKLSDDNLYELFDFYSNKDFRLYFDYLQCNLQYIIELKQRNNEYQNEINHLKNEIDQLKNGENLNIKKKKDNLPDHINQLDQKTMQFNNSEIPKNQIIDCKKLDPNGENVQISVMVKYKLLFNAKITINENLKYDKTKSKIIISKNHEKEYKINAYEKGELITTNNLSIDFACKAGTYYVKACIVDENGNMQEFISNSVTTNGNYLAFDYSGEGTKIILDEGSYKLEVWGAQGGDSAGHGRNEINAKGGLGGYK